MDNKDNFDKSTLTAHERLIKSRFYQWVMQNYNGQWAKAAADVKAFTGIDIPAETLRQNIMPVSKKSGKPPRRFSDKNRIEALKNFLINVNYLTNLELKEDNYSSYAPIAFAEFITGQTGSVNFGELGKFNGVFSCEKISSDHTEQIELQIDFIAQDKIVNAREISTIEKMGDSGMDDEIIHNGWVVCTNMGFYLIVLHSKDEQSTKCYMVLQSLPSITENKIINDIALMSYQSAWTGKLNKNSVAISDSVKNIEYSLPTKIEDLCFFFTRE